MQKHIKNFITHYKLAEGEFFPCQCCGEEAAVDIHHIIHRSQGGSDEIGNLIGLGRDCHLRAHYLQKPYLEAEELLEILNK